MINIPEISPLNSELDAAIAQIINNKTKPPGSLGQLEQLAAQLANVCGQDAGKHIAINNPCALIFAGDHGIAKESISIAPQVVTQQMVHNFLTGGAAINCFASVNNMQVKVIDTGVLEAIEHQQLINQRIAAGTKNFSETAAMTSEELAKCFYFAETLVNDLAKEGSNVLAFGEMGIGNTSAAAALMSAYLGLPADQCVGKGTGINDEQYQLKLSLIKKALELHQASFTDAFDTLAKLGGFEIAQMAAAMLYAASNRMLILVDGFISTAAAIAATKINPRVREYMVFCHSSEEAGHKAMLEALNATPLLQLKMRLGEGTGAALAMNLLYAAENFYNNMASFDNAGIDAV